MFVLDTLVRGLFDYAGMFPPAALSFEDMLAESALFGGLHRPFLVANDAAVAWPDAKRITPAALLAARYPRHELNIAVVGVQAPDAPAVAAEVVAWNDAATAASAVSDSPHQTRRRVTAVEAACPGLDEDDTRGIAAARDVLAEAGVALYAEPRLTDDEWATAAPDVWAFMDTLAADVGFKFRAAGPTGLSADTMAHILPAVAGQARPLKATQGLHHPIVEADRYGNDIGFLGLAMAVRLGNRIDDAERVALLQETDQAAFRFDNGVSWRMHKLRAQHIAEAARRQPFAVGSCSIGEPDADLVRLWPHRVPSILD